MAAALKPVSRQRQVSGDALVPSDTPAQGETPKFR
jgi:hypothetical protein